MSPRQLFPAARSVRGQVWLSGPLWARRGFSGRGPSPRLGRGECGPPPEGAQPAGGAGPVPEGKPKPEPQKEEARRPDAASGCRRHSPARSCLPAATLTPLAPHPRDPDLWGALAPCDPHSVHTGPCTPESWTWRTRIHGTGIPPRGPAPAPRPRGSSPHCLSRFRVQVPPLLLPLLALRGPQGCGRYFPAGWRPPVDLCPGRRLLPVRAGAAPTPAGPPRPAPLTGSAALCSPGGGCAQVLQPSAQHLG